jgi:hypothetical protein
MVSSAERGGRREEEGNKIKKVTTGDILEN